VQKAQKEGRPSNFYEIWSEEIHYKRDPLAKKMFDV
jgi:hypothetical protein